MRNRLPLIALVLALLVGFTSCSHFVVLHDALTATEHNDLGLVYEREGKLDLAAREYRKAVRLDPRLARARVNLGNVAAAEGRWSAAEKSYRRALRDEELPDALNNLAVALVRQSKGLDEAERLAARAVGLGGERDSLYRATLEEVRAARARLPR